MGLTEPRLCRKPGRSRRLLFLLFSLFLLEPFSSAWSQPVVGRVVGLREKVFLSRDGTRSWAEAKLSQDLFPGDFLKTDESGQAALLFSGDVLIRLNGRTLFQVKEGPSPRGTALVSDEGLGTGLFRLLTGELWFRSRRARPVIETPVVSASIRGTELGLRVGGDGESILLVIEGQVEYRTAEGSVLVASREEAIARAGEVPYKRILVQPFDAVQWTMLYPKFLGHRDIAMAAPDGRKQKADLRAARDALGVDRDDQEKRLLLAGLLREYGRPEEARRLYEDVLGLDPANGPARTGLGWTRLDLNLVEDAEALFLNILPESAESILGLSLCLDRRGKIGEARAEVERGLGLFGEDPRLLAQLAFLELRTGNPMRAADAANRVLERAPDMPAPLNVLAILHLAKNERKEALDKTRKALDRNPDSPSSHLVMSLVARSGFDLEEAAQHARRAVELDPRNVPAMLQLGELLFGSDRPDEALSWARKALESDPGEAQAHTLMGFLQLARGTAAGASQSFELALALDSLQGEAHLGLGIAAMRRGETGRGEEEIRMAVLLEPRRALFRSYLGKALFEQRRFAEALDALVGARSLDPLDPTPFLYASLFLTDLNEPGQAIRELHRSMDLNDRRAVYRSRLLLDRDLSVKNVSLGRAYEALGLAAWARDKALWSLKNDPGNSGAHQFFGSIISDLGESGQTAASELLKKRLLMPVNENSFSSFSDYTTFFDRPGFKGSAVASIGTRRDQDHLLVLSGGAGPAAFRQYLNYSDTRGPHPVNDESRAFTTLTIVKGQLSADQSLMASLAHNRLVEGDTSVDSDAWAMNDPDYRYRLRGTQWELGYHRHLGPRSDLLLYGMGQVVRHRVSDRGATEQGPYFYQSDFRLPGATAQALHQWGWKNHHLFYGGEIFEGQAAVDSSLLLPVLKGEQSYRKTVRRRFVTAFAEDSWRVLPTLFVEGALHFERAGYGDPGYSSREKRVSLWSPRAGLIWKPAPSITLRAAGGRFLQATHFDPRLSMGEIGGFTLGENASFATLNTESHLAWEQELGRRFFFSATAFHRERRTFCAEGRPPLYGFTWRSSLLSGLGLALNHLLGERTGLSFEYKFLTVRDREYRNVLQEIFIPHRTRRDHEARLRLAWVHPSGWKANAEEAFVIQRLDSGYGEPSPSAFWVTNVALAWELPGKRGEVSLGAENLFDRRFQLLTRELVIEERLPVRRVVLALRVNL
jgi:tetratricopeptide (TPR) repeat protein